MDYIIIILLILALLNLLLIGAVAYLFFGRLTKLKRDLLKILGSSNYAFVILLLLYVILPIDLIPDFIPLLGQSDDFVAIVLMVVDAIVGYLAVNKSKSNSGEIKADQD